MPLSDCRKSAGLMLVALPVALLALALPATAASPSAAELEEQTLKLDQAVQAFKKEALEFNTEAQGVEDEVLFPPHARLSVYLSVKVPGLLLKEVSVTVDGNAPQTFTYTDRDAKAMLSEGHMQRVLRTAVGAGAHRIRISYSGQMADAKPDAPPVGDSYEAVFDKDQRETNLEFSIARRTRLSKAGISMTQWRPKK
jgi:hypothetical protein